MTVLIRLVTTGLLVAAVVGCGSRTEQATPTTTPDPPVTITPTPAPLPTPLPPTSAPPATGPLTTEPPAAAPGEEHVVRAYFVRDTGRDFVVGPVARQVTGEGVAASAMEGLLTGPTPDEQQRLGLHSSIPEGTVLHGVGVRDGIATVDLSSEYESGGGTASMGNRVAQVVFTLTQFPTVDSVQFELDGQPVTLFSGEGLILEEPQARDDYEGLSPAILVESPLPFTEVASPLRLTGTANTFEATFQIQITAPDGTMLYDRFATATSGTGTRGTFDVTARFEPPAPGMGELRVFEYSAKDGSVINDVTIPVRMS